MDDSISRQEIIDKIEWYDEEEHMHPGYIKTEHALEMINNMPFVESERKKGEWIDYAEDGYVECPFCHSATNCDGNKDELHFCFSCGADMRGEQE